MGHQFFGFTAESFEQFARVLALINFGPGVTVFGDGPDGGREAIFKGTVPYPHPPAEQWSGYGVIQAKCKAKTGGTQADQKWALDQLKKELDLFVTSKKRSPEPEYYVFVTNVDFAAGGNGWDAADALLKAYYDKLPLKGHAVWGASQLSGYVDQHEEIRNRFRVHLTSGDVLGALIEHIHGLQPNTEHILATFLSRTLLDDEISRLDQAGKLTDERLPLAKLFIDLPATTEHSLEPPDEKPDDAGNMPPGVLKDLLRDGSRCLDPQTIYELETTQDATAKFPSRYVLLGGFGSGKSTIGQFLAQIHRAALLDRRPKPLLESDVRTAIAEIKETCGRERLPWPTTPRYPFRVELARFAKFLSDESGRTLAEYLRITLGGAATLAHETFLSWLSLVPWLLILDGLDEVPSAGNRDAVVKSVNDFLIEARQAKADLFVVATSRRDGYGGEFAGGLVKFQSFRPLSVPRALRYVEQYVLTRFGNTTQGSDLVDKLRSAAETPLTASLMSSPLQVTFMATVISAHGDAGQDRWQLFDSYYKTIYAREQQKAVEPFKSVLAGHKNVIDRLHHDIGFWLQFQSEAAGVNSVSIKISQFEQLVRAYLGPDAKGFEGEELKKLTETIATAAQQRLVFLTSRVEGELEFEVRGLQEHMAAERLMTGPPEQVLKRLEMIAPSPYWRNVFLFAAGKCFLDAQSSYYQDHLRLLCEDLNTSSDPVLEIVHAGSELGIAMLESGAPAQNPTYTRHLSKLALELLAQPEILDYGEEGAGVAERLRSVYRDAAKNEYCKALQTYVGQTELPRTLGAWSLLVRLCERGILWAQELAEQYWPHDVEDQMKIILSVPEWSSSTWLLKQVFELIPQFPPFRGFRLFYNEDEIFNSTPSWYQSAKIIFQLPWADLVAFSPSNLRGDPVRAFCSYLFDEKRSKRQAFLDIRTLPSPHQEWVPYCEAYRLFDDPGAKSLAMTLRACVDRGYDPAKRTTPLFFLRYLPWPLAVCLMTAHSQSEIAELATQVEQGQLGDASEWAVAECRWANRGIDLLDLMASTINEPLFNSSIATVGFPVFLLNFSVQDRMTWTHKDFQFLLDLTETVESTKGQRELLWLLCYVAAQCPNALENDFERLSVIFQRQGIQNNELTILAHVNPPRILGPQYLKFHNMCGLAHNPVLGWRHINEWRKHWEQAFIREPQSLGLLRLLGRCASYGPVGDQIPPELLMLDRYSDRRISFAALLVRLNDMHLTSSEAQELANGAVDLLILQVEINAADLLFSTVERHLDRVPALETFLLTLRKTLPSSIDLGSARCERLLRQLVRRRPSGLQTPGQLVALGLPNLTLPPT